MRRSASSGICSTSLRLAMSAPRSPPRASRPWQAAQLVAKMRWPSPILLVATAEGAPPCCPCDRAGENTCQGRSTSIDNRKNARDIRLFCIAALADIAIEYMYTTIRGQRTNRGRMFLPQDCFLMSLQSGSFHWIIFPRLNRFNDVQDIEREGRTEICYRLEQLIRGRDQEN